MKPVSFLNESVFVSKSKGKGRGVFTYDEITRGTIIEVAPVIVMSSKERKLIDETILHDYIFEWGDDRTECCMALGYVPLYNHSYESNCEYEMDFRKQTITIKTVKDIKAGEQLFINYNGDAKNQTPVWFDVS